MNGEDRLKSVYRTMILEAGERLDRASAKLVAANVQAYDLEEAALHLRKGLEAIAFAAIAPNQGAYAQIRAKADQAADFTKDYHAKRIFQDLARVNPDFFPLALKAPQMGSDRAWHFEQLSADSMSRNQFEKIYDGIARLMHAPNPWAPAPDHSVLQTQMKAAVNRARNLIERHAAFIRTPEFAGCWVIQRLSSGSLEILKAQAGGDFKVVRR